MEDLTALAIMLDQARIAANAIEATAPETGVYGSIKEALLDTLALILGNHVRAKDAYASILDGNTVTEALAWVRACEA
jgi:hypothetical protein